MINTFLKAEWRKLLMVNYPVDKKILDRFVPFKTEIDLWNDACYVSLVGFMFINTRIKGMKIPFHTNFEEVNLRFYVRYKDQDGWKRGVVFIKEIVPRAALTFIANTIYKEHYETHPMHHQWESTHDILSIEYRWKNLNHWNSIKVSTKKELSEISNGSEEEFITEHYWGYTKVGDQITAEYGVEHPRWKIYKTTDYQIEVNYGENYGQEFKFLDFQTPTSVFLAEGSEIEVKAGRII